MTAAFNNKLAALEDYSRRAISTEFTTPRLYSSLLLERQTVSVRRAKPFEQNLFATDGSDTIRKYESGAWNSGTVEAEGD